MPIYEYACRQCNQEFEILVRGQELPHCPDCGGEKLDRLLSVTAAPSSTSGKAADSMPGTCGRPQCGMGGCQGLGP